MYRSHTGVCVYVHEYQVPLSDTSDSESDTDYEWQQSTVHLIALDEKYRYLHAKYHNDFTAIAFQKKTQFCTASVFKNPCPTSSQTKSLRYCFDVPARNVQAYFEAPKKRISFRKTSLQRTFTYKPIRCSKKRACKEHKFRLFVCPKKLFCCDPKDQQQKIVNFDVSVLYPKQYKWTKSDAFFDFESSNNNSDSDNSCGVTDSTDCTELVIKAIEQRTTTAIMSGPINKDCGSVDYNSMVEVDMKEELEDLHLDDSKAILNPVKLLKSRSLCDEVDVNAPLQSNT